MTILEIKRTIDHQIELKFPEEMPMNKITKFKVRVSLLEGGLIPETVNWVVAATDEEQVRQVISHVTDGGFYNILSMELDHSDSVPRYSYQAIADSLVSHLNTDQLQ